jgi:nitrite reductase/ring-hydroxylating ferredoxin subunit
VSSIAQIDIGDLDSFPDRRVRVVSAANRDIGVVRWGDCLYAVRNVCPHQGAELCKGKLESFVAVGDEGSIESDRQRPILVCPWHRWEFDVITGAAVTDPKQRVATYPVEVKAGRVLVRIRGARDRPRAE